MIEADTIARRQKVFATISIGIFVTSIANTNTIGLIPLQFYLKNQLRAGPQSVATFTALAALAWYLKPFAGILSDRLRLFGTRRRHYLILATGFALFGWLALGWVPRTYAWLLATCIFLNCGVALASSVTGGLLVEVGQRFDVSRRLAAWRTALGYFSILIAGPLAGYLATRSMTETAIVGAGLTFPLLPAALGWLREIPTPWPDPRLGDRSVSVNVRPAAKMVSAGTLRSLTRARGLWMAAGYIFLLQLSPGFQSTLFFYQTKALGFSATFLGTIQVVSGATGILATGVYGILAHRLSLRILLITGIFVAAISSLSYLFYGTATSAIIVEIIAAVGGTFAVIPLFELAARATPVGFESMGYAMLMALYNLATACSDIIGSWIFETHGVGFHSLVWINAGTTLLVLAFIPLLPPTLLRHQLRPRESSVPLPSAAVDDNDIEI